MKVLTLKEIEQEQRVLYKGEFEKYLKNKGKRKKGKGKRKFPFIPSQLQGIPSIKVNPCLRKERKGKYIKTPSEKGLNRMDKIFIHWYTYKELP